MGIQILQPRNSQLFYMTKPRTFFRMHLVVISIPEGKFFRNQGNTVKSRTRTPGKIKKKRAPRHQGATRTSSPLVSVKTSPSSNTVTFEPCVDDVKIAIQHIDIYKVGSFRLGQPIIPCSGRHPDHLLLCLDMGVLRTAIGNIALKQFRELLLHFLIKGAL